MFDYLSLSKMVPIKVARGYKYSDYNSLFFKKKKKPTKYKFVRRYAGFFFSFFFFIIINNDNTREKSDKFREHEMLFLPFYMYRTMTTGEIY